jgi:hypothetical protein
MIVRTVTDFFFVLFGVIVGSLLGALGFGQFIICIINCIIFKNMVLSFNFDLFDINVIGIGLFCFMMGLYFLHRTLSDLYINQEDD